MKHGIILAVTTFFIGLSVTWAAWDTGRTAEQQAGYEIQTGDECCASTGTAALAAKKSSIDRDWNCALDGTAATCQSHRKKNNLSGFATSPYWLIE
jgi:hypothetical protein